MGNITHYVNSDTSLKILKKGVHASDMDLLLSSTGPYTIFAPSDLAFLKLQDGYMEELFEPQNRHRLAQLVKNHVVKGTVSLSELKDGDTLTTVNGKQLLVQAANGSIRVNEVAVRSTAAQATNGVVHLIDSVLAHV